jgi:stage V sporulation protein AC
MKIKDDILKKEFENLSKKHTPKPKIFLHSIFAFLFGGMFCIIGQFFYNILLILNVPNELLGTYVSIIMIFIGALLTGLGVYDKLANVAGAGTVVPITGFANSIVSPAMEFKREGFIFGVAARMFVIAGPVLVYGISSSVIVGVLYYFFKIF